MNFQNLQSLPDDRYNNFSNNLDNNLTKPIEQLSSISINNKLEASPISIAKLIKEKENLTNALKREIIKNEEQRNYIQVLKETIESNLFRSGFAEILASSKEYQQFQEYNKGQGKTMADFVIDFIKFKEETNKYKKDLLLSNNIISDSKNEIDNLNKKVNDIEKKNLELINDINEKQNEKQYMLLKDSENNDIINKLNNNIRILEEENNSLKNQISELQKLNIKNENKNKNKIMQYKRNVKSDNLNKYSDYEEKYKNLLSEYDKIKLENEENGKQKDKLEKLYQTVKDENNLLTDKYKNLENELKSLGKSVNEVNNKYDNNNSYNSYQYQDEINKLKIIINNKEKENKELIDKLNILSSKGDIINVENRNNKQRIKDCMSSIDRLKFEKNVIGDEFVNLQQKYENILIDYNKSQNQNELLSTNFDRLKKEYNILLEEKNRQDIELENNINLKYLKDKEINDIENKYNQDFEKLQKENMELNKTLKNTLDKMNDLNQKNYKLKEINEITNQQLREKIENEQILLKENLNYKASLEDLNIKHKEDIDQLNNKINNYKDLNKNYNTMKSQYNDLQKLLKSSSEEKSKLIDNNKKLIEENKNIDEQYQSSISKLRGISKKNFDENTLSEFIKQCTDEIINLEKEKNKLNETIKSLNIKCFDTAQKNQNNIQENNKLKNMLNNLTNNYNNDLAEKENLLKEIDNYKLMNYQLQKTIDDYGIELNSKITELNNISYNRCEMENNNIKLNNDKEFLLTILLRLTKLFSHSNIYDIVNDVFNNSKFNEKDKEYQNKMNQKLLLELQRCEDYINILKENDLQANYLNLKLNQELQDLNLQKLRNETKMPMQNYSSDNNINNFSNISKDIHSFNTLNNTDYLMNYDSKYIYNKYMTD